MADPTAHFYSQFFTSAFNKEIDIDSDTFVLMLLDDTYTPNLDTHRYKSDLTGEITGTGYTAGGVAVSPLTVSYNSAAKKLSFDGANASWDEVTFDNVRYAALVDMTPGTDATRPLVGLVDFGADQVRAAAPFGVTWNADGIGTVTVA